MNTLFKTYKFKLKPTKDQITLLNKHFGATRFIYNHFLNDSIKQYETSKTPINYYKQAKDLTQLKNELIWLKEINSQSLQHSLKHLSTAYKNFFRTKIGFPKFKSKHHKNSFHIPQHIKVVKNKLYIPKIKGVKLIKHQQIKGKIKSCTISKVNNKYHVTILTEQIIKLLPKTNKQVGIDLGIKEFAILSNSTKIKNNKYTKKYKTKLTKAQQHLSRKKKGSNRFENQKLKVARIHEKISNSRLNFQHQLSKKLITEFDTICIENLNIKKMLKNKQIAKHISDVAWNQFVTQLKYKADWYGKTVIQIAKFYPSSKTCFHCKSINHNLTLKDRDWTCDTCKNTLDRDINAAKNILFEGLKSSSAGTVDYRCEENAFSESFFNETSKIHNAKVSAPHLKLQSMAIAVHNPFVIQLK